MLLCKKCRGRMMVDDTFSGNSAYEIACIMCGTRVTVSKTGNALGRWLASG